MPDASMRKPTTPVHEAPCSQGCVGELYQREFTNIVSNIATPDFFRAMVSALNECTPDDALKYASRLHGLAELRFNESRIT